MELRQAGKDEAQGDVQSEKNSNTGVTFSKLHPPLYWLRPFFVNIEYLQLSAYEDGTDRVFRIVGI